MDISRATLFVMLLVSSISLFCQSIIGNWIARKDNNSFLYKFEKNKFFYVENSLTYDRSPIKGFGGHYTIDNDTITFKIEYFKWQLFNAMDYTDLIWDKNNSYKTYRVDEPYNTKIPYHKLNDTTLIIGNYNFKTSFPNFYIYEEPIDSLILEGPVTN